MYAYLPLRAINLPGRVNASIVAGLALLLAVKRKVNSGICGFRMVRRHKNVRPCRRLERRGKSMVGLSGMTMERIKNSRNFITFKHEAYPNSCSDLDLFRIYSYLG